MADPARRARPGDAPGADGAESAGRYGGTGRYGGAGRGSAENAEGAAGQARRWGVNLASFLLGLVAAPLPARWRRAVPLLESSAYPEASIPSALLQVVTALLLFAMGYVAWINGQYELIDKAAEASGGDTQEKRILGRALMMGNPLILVVYALTSAAGFSTVVAFLGGGIRMVHGAVTKDVMPDPVLGLIDFGLSKLQRKAAFSSRERSKDRSPDKLFLGSPADGYAIAIETASDFDWREGNTIVVASTWYRLKSRSETRTADGLRLRYVLEEMPVGVAIRGLRRYDPGHAPIIVGSDGGTG